MNSAVIQIADGIVQAINSGPGYSQPVTAVRSYRARFELRDLGALKVVVVPATWQLEPFDRTHDGLTIRTDIGVLKKLTSAEGTPELQAEMDASQRCCDGYLCFAAAVAEAWAQMEMTVWTRLGIYQL